MSIYFLRHIKTVYNTKNLISGCKDAEPLPGQTLILPENTEFYFDCVISSPLKRCVATVDLLPTHSYDRIEFSERLIERNVGVLEGISKKEAIAQYPNLFCNGKLDVNVAIPNGETIAEVIERLSPIANNLISYQETMNILVCSHNQTLKVLLALLWNTSLTNEYWKTVNFPNGTLVCIDDLPNTYC